MKNLFFPVLCGVFCLFFSGKTALQNNCGPHFTFQKTGTMTVTQVKVENLTTGNVNTFNNPTFPFDHVDTGGDIVVTYYFSASSTGCLLVSEPECEVVQYTNETSVSYWVSAFNCYIYDIRVYSRPPGTACFACQ